MDEIFGVLIWFIRTLIIEFLFYTVFYWIGWGVCKFFTLGKYPKPLGLSENRNKGTYVMLVGIAFSLTVFMAFIYWG